MDKISEIQLREILNLKGTYVTSAADVEKHRLAKGEKYYLEKVILLYKECNYFCSKEEFEGSISKVDFLVKPEYGKQIQVDAKFFEEVISIISRPS